MSCTNQEARRNVLYPPQRLRALHRIMLQHPRCQQQTLLYQARAKLEPCSVHAPNSYRCILFTSCMYMLHDSKQPKNKTKLTRLRTPRRSKCPQIPKYFVLHAGRPEQARPRQSRRRCSCGCLDDDAAARVVGVKRFPQTRAAIVSETKAYIAFIQPHRQDWGRFPHHPSPL